MNINVILTLIATAVVGGPAAMLLAQAIKRRGWPTLLKEALVAVIAAAVALAGLWISGSVTHMIGSWHTLTASEYVAFIAAVWASAKAFYASVWGVQPWMDSLAAWPGKIASVVEDYAPAAEAAVPAAAPVIAAVNEAAQTVTAGATITPAATATAGTVTTATQGTVTSTAPGSGQ